MEKKKLVYILIFLALLLANVLLWKLSSTQIIANVLLWKLSSTQIIAVVAVLGIALSTVFSLRATTIARKAAQGELIMKIQNIYNSSEMLKAMMGLVWWVEKKEEEGEDWLETFKKLRKNRDRYHEIRPVDRDRRKFSNYYEAIEIIKKQHLLSPKTVKRLCSESQELLYKMIVRPLTEQIETKVTKEWPELTVDYPEGYYAKRKLRDIEQKKINDQKKK